MSLSDRFEASRFPELIASLDRRIKVLERFPARLSGYVPTGAVKASVSTFESTTSTVVTNLATVGPQASLVVPSSGKVRADLQAWVRNATVGEQTYFAFDLTGAATQGAAFDQAAVWEQGSPEYLTLSTAVLFDGLTPGLTLTVTAKYWVAAGTGWFGRRRLILTPQ